MRALFTISIICFLMPLQAQTFQDNADKFFAKYVNDGRVNYAAIKKDPALLDDLVQYIGELDLSNKRVSGDFLKSFYINSYNILVIKQVVDLYPIDNPLKVNGFFDGIRHKVMNQEMTLNDLEKKTLYAQFPDPRLHFVLVCAAKGCPPLANYSYKASVLNEQLDERTKYVLNLDWFIRVNRSEVELSQIFNWYSGDFIVQSKDVVSYINQYRKVPISKYKKAIYYEYDWTLNEQ